MLHPAVKDLDVKIPTLCLALSLMNAFCISEIVTKHQDAFQRFSLYACKVNFFLCIDSVLLDMGKERDAKDDNDSN